MRLKGIQESLPTNPNNYLINLEKNLRVEFSKVVKLEGEFLVMKSWILWLVEGDSNASFYHTSTLVCRRRNQISYVKDRMRNRINGDREIADFIRGGFSDLFTSSHSSSLLTEWNPLLACMLERGRVHKFR